MPPLLLKAIIYITLALIFYTVGVWSEKIEKNLKKWHLLMFYLGLICDGLGTKYMSELSGGFEFSFHGITGGIAIILMFFHAFWATQILVQKDEEKKKTFHKFSILVWGIWLIPYLLGMLVGMKTI